jgi:hypothetical protein
MPTTTASGLIYEDKVVGTGAAASAGQVIKGWDEGVHGMQVGGTPRADHPAEPGLRLARRGRRDCAQCDADFRGGIAQRGINSFGPERGIVPDTAQAAALSFAA